MLKFDRSGIYCEPARVYIDPWKPVERAIITHAHSDHARWGSKHYLCHHLSAPIIQLRLGNVPIESVEYNEPFVINGVQISLHPAGHIPGSAQIRMEYKGEVWVVSGDYKLQHDGISTPFEPLPCHHFVTESTFGLPIYNFPSTLHVHDEINNWWRNNQSNGVNSVIIGYALGKAQRIIKHLDTSIGKIFVHGAVKSVTDAFGKQLELPAVESAVNFIKKEDAGSIIVAPPSAVGTPWMKRFEPYSLALCSGWMQLRGARRRRGGDRGFVLSDHADWSQLNEAVKATGAENIYVTHGYKTSYARWLREHFSLNAVEVDTVYEGENIEETKAEDLALNED